MLQNTTCDKDLSQDMYAETMCDTSLLPKSRDEYASVYIIGFSRGDGQWDKGHLAPVIWMISTKVIL